MALPLDLSHWFEFNSFVVELFLETIALKYRFFGTVTDFFVD